MIRRLALLMLAPPLLLLAAALLWLQSSVPVTRGAVVLAGLGAPVTVARDAHGVPTIRAESERDAVFALGYVHAQDRLFQMEMTRRLGAGRLSEVIGEATLRLDRTMRTFGLDRLAEAQLALLSAEARAGLDAYAAGVNAFLADRSRALPPEYYLLRFRPEPWRPADSLLWARLMAVQLSGNHRGEMLRARILEKVGAEGLALLYPTIPAGASNNWVVDGSRSASGKPVLADDPHLGFGAPGTFYLARLEWPGRAVAGATAPGNPLVVIGHNSQVAWGFTTTGGDVADLFIEKLEGEQYLTPDGPLSFTTREEVIAVRGRAPERLVVRETRHGPVVSELLGDATPGHVLALQASFLLPDDRTPEALYAMNRARNAAEFEAALRLWGAPQQSIVYADREGSTGMIAPGRIPIRRSGEGWLPAQGWTGDADWIGWIPFEELPRAQGPRIVTANNRIVGEDYRHFISRDWDLGYRARRITELIDSRPAQTAELSAQIQADSRSLMAEELLPLFLAASPQSPRAAEAMKLLAAWDRVMRADDVAPLLFTAWLRELERLVFAGMLGPLFDDYPGFRPMALRRMLDREQDRTKLGAALEAALADLAGRYGSDMRSWTWGRAHAARFENNVFARLPLIGRWTRNAVPVDGGYDTVNRAHMALRSEADPFASIHGSVLRFVIDMAEPAAARFMVVPGQSGNPFSRHWGDLVGPWRDFVWITFGGEAASTLELVPR